MTDARRATKHEAKKREEARPQHTDDGDSEVPKRRPTPPPFPPPHAIRAPPRPIGAPAAHDPFPRRRRAPKAFTTPATSDDGNETPPLPDDSGMPPAPVPPLDNFGCSYEDYLTSGMGCDESPEYNPFPSAGVAKANNNNNVLQSKNNNNNNVLPLLAMWWL